MFVTGELIVRRRNREEKATKPSEAGVRHKSHATNGRAGEEKRDKTRAKKKPAASTEKPAAVAIDVGSTKEEESCTKGVKKAQRAIA